MIMAMNDKQTYKQHMHTGRVYGQGSSNFVVVVVVISLSLSLSHSLYSKWKLGKFLIEEHHDQIEEKKIEDWWLINEEEKKKVEKNTTSVAGREREKSMAFNEWMNEWNDLILTIFDWLTDYWLINFILFIN